MTALSKSTVVRLKNGRTCKVKKELGRGGQGIVYRNQEKNGNINVRRDAFRNSTVIAQIPEFDGVPDTYPCLGVKNGYYKIRINEKEGYVRMDMAEWDGMSSF